MKRVLPVLGVVCLFGMLVVCGCQSQDKTASNQPLQPKGATHFERALDYEAQEEPDLAVQEYRKAIVEKPADSRAYVNAGRISARMGKDGEAERYWRQAVTVNPGDARAYNCLGGVYMRQGKYGKAITYYTRAVDANPKYAESHWNIAAAYRAMNMKAEASEHYRQYIELAGGDSERDVQEAKSFVTATAEQ